MSSKLLLLQIRGFKLKNEKYLSKTITGKLFKYVDIAADAIILWLTNSFFEH